MAGANTWRDLVMFLRPSELKLLTPSTSTSENRPVDKPTQTQVLENSFGEKQKLSIKEMQQALSDAGLDPGPVDGIRGRKTIKAIKAFQIANGLAADGLVGLITKSVLFKNRNLNQSEEFAIPNTIPWIETAYSLIGTQEKPGAGSNEAIMGWAEDLELTSYNDDDIP